MKKSIILAFMLAVSVSSFAKDGDPVTSVADARFQSAVEHGWTAADWFKMFPQHVINAEAWLAGKISSLFN